MKDQFGREHDILEVLIADALLTEPFPNEIKITGVATAWREKLQYAAKQRGVNIEIIITELPKGSPTP
ncbi:MAG TPA: hypothetical protein VHY35_17870 [Stellaceae bacterium]|jgi:hypothetical protein|nr:hypothetical protein [Stellaceae bacterium]